ncbi:C4-dicarboxylate TRAP transporter substrate-binding protein [Thermosediminibacter litoriperuensis]|uniref:Tripartite ATP-independent transporter DctP family solute receptor n=1 Tax=Thermosediminibacter litoriperuensis TaxID=291989 RepID=A0A5S5AYV0_9FIRM|nr:C4-dicarboxylate TRAP transporter substrate-binding protein [Thermosediminibacter litoriperuensis]TYP58812.1 tripartite ATP-independent transporter DctP family solute receptor [Thermosediminibacter litoriperuensis]
MKKILSVVLVLVMVLVVMTGCSGGSKPEGNENSAPADDGKVYTLKMSTQLNETHPMVDGFKELAKRVAEKTGGKLVIEVYPSAQLGSDEDVIEQAIQGVNVAVLTDGGRMGNYVKEMGIIGMPYFADSYEDILKVTQSDTFKEWEKQLAEEHGIRVLSFNWYDGARHFLTNKPVTKPADLNGLRIRTPGAPVWSESVKAMGATPVSMPWTEVYPAMQQKAIDGAEGQHTATYSSRLYEVLKYINKTAHFQLVNGIIVGEKWFKTLPAEYQQILRDETKAVAAENAKLIMKLSDEYEAKMVEKGMKVVEVDIEAFKEAADKAYDALGFRELKEKIYAEIGKK